MTKVRQGFNAARVAPTDIVKIFGMFDRLSTQDAQTVAERTEFSVSTSAKFGALFETGHAESKRQMARAAMYLDDLSALAMGLSLSPKISDAEFERMWRGDELALQTMVSRLVSRLCAPPPAPPQVDGATVVLTPRPRRPKVRVSPETLRLLQQNLARAAGHYQSTLAGTAGPTTPVTFAWNAGKTELIRLFALQVNTSLAQMTSLQTAANGAYTEFKAFVSEAAAEVEFYLDIAKKVFEALKEAPFPFSVVGNVGTAICGALHVDSTIRQTRQPGDRRYFDSDIPLLSRATILYEQVSDKVGDLTRLGVTLTPLPSRTTLTAALDSAKNQSITVLNKVFNDAVTTTYGGTPDDVREKCLAFATSVRTLINPNAPWATVEPLVLAKMRNAFDVTKKAIEGGIGKIIVDSAKLQPFIELELYAEYMAQVAPGDDFDVTIPDALIRRLEGDPFFLVMRKTGSGQTAQIYGAKKLPWDAHPRHIGAVILFFRWYRKEVNPFNIAVGRASVQAVRDAMETTIVEIGQAIAAHAVTRRLRHDTADWAAVQTTLAGRTP